MYRYGIWQIYKTVVEGHTARLREHKKIAIVVEKEQRRALSRMATTKNPKNTQLKSKKMMREVRLTPPLSSIYPSYSFLFFLCMSRGKPNWFPSLVLSLISPSDTCGMRVQMLVFWKRNEKDERENRKKAERVALDKAKKEEEERESKRQSRKLNFLITQTELYSHFVGSKIKSSFIFIYDLPFSRSGPAKWGVRCMRVEEMLTLSCFARWFDAAAEAEQSEDTAGSGLPSIAEAEMPNAAAVELADAEKELAELDFGDGASPFFPPRVLFSPFAMHIKLMHWISLRLRLFRRWE
jgi:hypothetical protein